MLTHGLVAVGAGVGGGKSDAATANASDHLVRTATATATVTTKPAASTQQDGTVSTIAGDGEHQVGQDMRPGTYRTAGPVGGSSSMCYRERDKDPVIANDNLAGSGLVTVRKGEIFKSVGCQNWASVR
ncbi:hypothetical protein I2501_29870 [Streptacidiphilus sp. NEAU-YB345]|uniref:Uncharacterized protein n=1 Tax=Streptacidiphilus fuscans TaxID=2789292 RepID=A0A931FEX0_9ACTN|nr:hypothetical protein [Streptacidiphilus fuscans]